MDKLMNSPRSVDISLTNNCNLRCLYCYHFSSEGDTGVDLPVEDWLDFFETLKKNSVMDITLSGGEPLVYKDFKKIVLGIKENNMRYSILTNGTLIDEDIAKFISESKRCNYVQVSIDGHKAAIHEKTRGKDTFKPAVNGIKNLMKFDIPTTVRVTINKHNVYHLEDIAKFLLEDLKLKGFSTNSAGYIGLCRENSNDIQLNTKEREFAIKTLYHLNKKYKNRISALSGPLYESRVWPEMIKAAKNKANAYNNGGRLTACGCVWSKIGVKSDGTLIPCNQIPHMEMGKIQEVDFKKVWQDHPVMQKMRERMKIPLSEFEFCKGCPYINYCTGNCPSGAYNISGDAFAPNKESCLRKYLAEGGKLDLD